MDLMLNLLIKNIKKFVKQFKKYILYTKSIYMVDLKYPSLKIEAKTL